MKFWLVLEVVFYCLCEVKCSFFMRIKTLKEFAISGGDKMKPLDRILSVVG